MQRVSLGIAPQLLAEFGHEVRKFDVADVRTALKVIMPLGDGRYPQACVLQCISDVL